MDVKTFSQEWRERLLGELGGEALETCGAGDYESFDTAFEEAAQPTL